MFNQTIKLFTLFLLGFVFASAVHAQLDDPTRPPGYRLVLPNGKKGLTTTQYTLSSVRISSSRRTAIVNDHTVEVGNSVNGAKVIAIYPSSVELKKKGKVFTVRLLSSRIAKKNFRQ